LRPDRAPKLRGIVNNHLNSKIGRKTVGGGGRQTKVGLWKCLTEGYEKGSKKNEKKFDGPTQTVKKNPLLEKRKRRKQLQKSWENRC